jgi:hypothetical protein
VPGNLEDGARGVSFRQSLAGLVRVPVQENSKLGGVLLGHVHIESQAFKDLPDFESDLEFGLGRKEGL